MSRFINKISKTRFINGINCPRFFPLFEIYKKRTEAVVSFKDDLSDLMDEENDFRKKELLGEMYQIILNESGEAIEEDLITPKDEQLEIMMPYYKEIERLSAHYAAYLFGQPVSFSSDTRNQKMIEAQIGDYQFYSFLDGYQVLDEFVHIIESKATTTRKFLNLTFKNDEKEKLPIFEKSPDGILMTRAALGLDTSGDYQEKVKKLFNRLHDVGSYLYDIAYQRYVIEASDKIKKPVKYFLAVLNSDYVFDGVYKNGAPDYLKDLGKEQFIITLIDVTDVTEMMLPSFKRDVEEVIDRLDHMTYDLENPGPLCPRKGKHKCMFHEICYQHVPKKNSIYQYFYNHHGFKDEKGEKHLPEELIAMGIKKMLDVPFEWLQRKSNQIQYEVVRSKVPFIQKERIHDILEKLVYPLYHFDFESFPCPLPRYQGETPYSQSLFQFNVHIEVSPGVVDKEQDSYYFLANDHQDQRKALTEKLLSYIGDQGTVIVWNQGFEKARFKELIQLFPEHTKALESIIERTFDLMYVLRGNHHDLYDKWGIPKQAGLNYYDEALQGSYSIKKVLPIFVPQLSYDNLDIQNGTEAMVTYAQFPQMQKTEFTKQYQALVEYCKQDTWAMVEILRHLRNIVKPFENGLK